MPGGVKWRPVEKVEHFEELKFGFSIVSLPGLLLLFRICSIFSSFFGLCVSASLGVKVDTHLHRRGGATKKTLGVIPKQTI